MESTVGIISYGVNGRDHQLCPRIRLGSNRNRPHSSRGRAQINPNGGERSSDLAVVKQSDLGLAVLPLRLRLRLGHRPRLRVRTIFLQA